jgi:hypothetical protein
LKVFLSIVRHLVELFFTATSLMEIFLIVFFYNS